MGYSNDKQRSPAEKNAPQEVPLGAPHHVSIFLSHIAGGGLILVAIIIAR